MVSLSDLDRNALTDAEGRYYLRQVPPGPQHVVVRRIGHTSQTSHFDVRAPLPIRGLEVGESTAYPDRGLSFAAVRHHPLLPEPDVLQAEAGGGERVELIGIEN